MEVEEKEVILPIVHVRVEQCLMIWAKGNIQVKSSSESDGFFYEYAMTNYPKPASNLESYYLPSPPASDSVYDFSQMVKSLFSYKYDPIMIDMSR